MCTSFRFHQFDEAIAKLDFKVTGLVKMNKNGGSDAVASHPLILFISPKCRL